MATAASAADTEEDSLPMPIETPAAGAGARRQLRPRQSSCAKASGATQPATVAGTQDAAEEEPPPPPVKKVVKKKKGAASPAAKKSIKKKKGGK